MTRDPLVQLLIAAIVTLCAYLFAAATGWRPTAIPLDDDRGSLLRPVRPRSRELRDEERR